MISRIPKDGSTVDLQALFMLTIDSATEFRFGTGTAVLGGIANERGNQFSERFGYATETIGFKNRLGKLTDFFPDKKFKAAQHSSKTMCTLMSRKLLFYARRP
jgi:hypothetical protein